MNDQLFAEQMNILGVIFDKEITKELLAVYLAVLERYSDINFKAAVELYVAEGRFFPKPSELIELMADMPADHERVERNRRLTHAKAPEKTPAERDAARRRVDGYIAQLRKVVGIADPGVDSPDVSPGGDIDRSECDC